MGFLLTASFVAGFVPAVAFTVLYAWRSPWRAEAVGRAVMALMIVTVLSYGASVATLVAPGWFRSDPGTAVRIGIRVIIAAVLWRLLVLLWRLQRGQR